MYRTRHLSVLDVRSVRAADLRLQDPSKTNVGKLNDVRREVNRNRYFRKKKEYLKNRINKVAVNSTNDNIRYLY
jgi:hypothetical protein